RAHVMFVALFGVPVAAWWALALWTAADRRPFVLASIRAGVVTLLLTAYYWLPASLEKRYTLLAARLGDSWADHFVAPMQLVRGTWGFSFDVPGLPNRMSFQLGLAQWGNREHVAVPGWEAIPDAHWWRSAATSSDYDEYTPATFEPSACSPEDPELVTLAGDAESRMLARRSNALSFASTVRSDGALVQATVAWYPGRPLFVDGRRSALAHRRGRVRARVPRRELVAS